MNRTFSGNPYWQQPIKPGLKHFFGPHPMNLHSHTPGMNSSMQGLMTQGTIPAPTPLLNIQSLFNRFGGIDGIISMIGRIQKTYQTYQQIRPILDIAGGLFSKNKVETNTEAPEQKNEPKKYTKKQQSTKQKRISRTHKKKRTRRKT
jgi:hypothetical protein